MRSLTEPPGLKDSILAQTSASLIPGRALSLTTGVEPIRSRTDRAPFKFATMLPVFRDRRRIRIDDGQMLYFRTVNVNETTRSSVVKRASFEKLRALSRRARRFHLLLTDAPSACAR